MAVRVVRIADRRLDLAERPARDSFNTVIGLTGDFPGCAVVMRRSDVAGVCFVQRVDMVEMNEIGVPICGGSRGVTRRGKLAKAEKGDEPPVGLAAGPVGCVDL